MNSKRIAARLKRVLNDFTESITDDKVRSLVKKNTIVTGGAIVSLLRSDEPSDYDLYFRDKETVLAVARYYVDKFNEKNIITNNCGITGQQAFVLDGALPVDDQIDDAGENVWKSNMLSNITEDRVKIIVRSDGVASENPVEPIEDILDDASELEVPKKKGKKLEKYRPVFLSTNAITLSDKIQLIVRFYGEPEDIHKTYDFVHCKNYWVSWEPGKVKLYVEALEAIMNKQLVYQGSEYPVCSIFRIRKFMARGWTINVGQILKIAFQVSELDLSDVDTLEDQLIGVDTLYFEQFISILREAQDAHKKLGKPLEITNNYVSTIVDRIFG